MTFDEDIFGKITKITLQPKGDILAVSLRSTIAPSATSFSSYTFITPKSSYNMFSVFGNGANPVTKQMLANDLAWTTKPVSHVDGSTDHTQTQTFFINLAKFRNKTKIAQFQAAIPGVSGQTTTQGTPLFLVWFIPTSYPPPSTVDEFVAGNLGGGPGGTPLYVRGIEYDSTWGTAQDAADRVANLPAGAYEVVELSANPTVVNNSMMWDLQMSTYSKPMVNFPLDADNAPAWDTSMEKDSADVGNAHLFSGSPTPTGPIINFSPRTVLIQVKFPGLTLKVS